MALGPAFETCPTEREADLGPSQSECFHRPRPRLPVGGPFLPPRSGCDVSLTKTDLSQHPELARTANVIMLILVDLTAHLTPGSGMQEVKTMPWLSSCTLP